MAKLIRTYRINPEVDAVIKAEAERLTELQGDKVSEADVIEFAVIKWCSADNTVEAPDRRAIAEQAMNDAATSKPVAEPPRPAPSRLRNERRVKQKSTLRNWQSRI